jgi:hypothetical protein
VLIHPRGPIRKACESFHKQSTSPYRRKPMPG